jgi:5-methylthioadenosine/S-adenosylhomocysteine deaminase
MSLRKHDAGPVLLSGGLVVDAVGATTKADVLIEDGLISSIGPSLPAPAGVYRIEAREGYVIPGLVNCHTHAHNNLSKSSGDKWTLEQLQSRSPALYGGRTADEQYLSAALGAIEMIKSGCTAAYDQFASVPAMSEEAVEAVVQAYDDVGLRAVLAPTISDRSLYDEVPGLPEALPPWLRARLPATGAGPSAQRLLQLAEQAIRRFDGAASGRIHIGVGPVIPQLCSDELLQGCARISAEYGASVHTHLAESKVQAVGAFERWGKSVVGHLGDVGLLSPRLVAAHAIWITDADLARLADSGSCVVHNPGSNLRLGNGIAPVTELLKHGVVVGLGSDGGHSSDNQNMFEAMRLAALIGRIRAPYDSDSWVGARDAWTMATSAGARVLGQAGEIGVVRVGANADLVVLGRTGLSLLPVNNLLHQLVYSETGSDVTDVIIDGRHVMSEGQLLTVDEGALIARAEAAAEASRGRNSVQWELASQIDPYLNAACARAAAQEFVVDRFAAEAAGVLAAKRHEGAMTRGGSSYGQADQLPQRGDLPGIRPG